MPWSFADDNTQTAPELLRFSAKQLGSSWRVVDEVTGRSRIVALSEREARQLAADLNRVDDDDQ